MGTPRRISRSPTTKTRPRQGIPFGIFTSYGGDGAAGTRSGQTIQNSSNTSNKV